MENRNNNLTVETNDMRGGFYLISVRDEKTQEILMYGSYHGGTNGELIIPPGATFDTNLLIDVIGALKSAYPDTNWKLSRDKDKEEDKS